MCMQACQHAVLNSFSYGASILVDTPTASTTFDQLAHNPQCFALYEDPLRPPVYWNDVCSMLCVTVDSITRNLVVAYVCIGVSVIQDK